MGLMLYVIFSTGLVSSFGTPASTGPGTSTSLPSCIEARNTCGMDWICAIQKPHEEPEHDPIQSKQSGSCSAPTTTVPPLGTSPEKTVVDLFEPPVLALEP